MSTFSKVIESSSVVMPGSATMVQIQGNKVFPVDSSGNMPVLRRSGSLDEDAYFPIKPLARATSQMDMEDEVDTFEGWRARTSATVLTLAPMFLFTGASYANAEHWYDWVSSLAWHGSLWAIPHLTIHREKTPLNVLAFVLSVMPLVLQPHMNISRRVSYIGAIHGSASVIVTCRILQYYLNQDDFKGWKRWRRMFFTTAWGWHDLRQVRHVKNETMVEEKLIPELKRLGKWSALMIATVAFHLWWGKPADMIKPGEGFTRRVIRYYFFRWAVGFWTLLSWFNTMDALPRALHFWADGHELRHISEDPWGARTLRDFWGRRWNVPVQEMLTQGVFKPISKMKWLPMRKTIAKLMVFVVSASGHTYAISCGGSPWPHLRAMFSFFMLQIPLLAMEDTFKFEGLSWMLASELPLAPLFIEPCLTFVHL